jgi:hypothetical protein
MVVPIMLQTLSRIRHVEDLVPTATCARRVHKRRGENDEATKESRREERGEGELVAGAHPRA